jgi:hypothetical protein
MSSLDGRPGFNRQILEALHEKHAEDPVIRLTATRSTRSPYSSRMLAIVTRSNRNANRLRRSVWLPVTRRPPPRGGGGRGFAQFGRQLQTGTLMRDTDKYIVAGGQLWHSRFKRWDWVGNLRSSWLAMRAIRCWSSTWRGQRGRLDGALKSYFFVCR